MDTSHALLHHHTHKILQVERALTAHSTGHFIEDHRPFSEKAWGHRTPIYLGLAKKMSAAQWAGFYGMLRTHENIKSQLEEYNKPTEQWTDDPNEYFIVGSDSEEE
jgi:hypothetical protein